MRTQLTPLQKGGGAPSPILCPCLLWSNGWMDQDDTWHGGRSSSRPHCARWGPSSPHQKGGRAPNFRPISIVASSQFSVHVYCGQTAGWMKTPLGMEVDFGPCYVVLDGDPAAPRKGHSSPLLFGPCLWWPRSPILSTAELLHFPPCIK